MPESIRQSLRFIQLCQSFSSRFNCDILEGARVVYDMSLDLDLNVVI